MEVFFLKVTLYGDSILKGITLENGRYNINHEWEDRFSRQFDATIRNRSRFGCTIEKALQQIRRDADRGYEDGEYAILEFGGNDCDYNWAEIAEAPKSTHLCKTPPELFVRDYEEAIDLIRASGRTVVVLTLPPIHSERYLHFICRDGLSRDRILTWMGDVERIYRWQETYSELVKKIAQKENVRLIDLRDAFMRDERPLEELLCDDGIHPSRMGQALIFDTLCSAAA